MLFSLNASSFCAPPPPPDTHTRTHTHTHARALSLSLSIWLLSAFCKVFLPDRILTHETWQKLLASGFETREKFAIKTPGREPASKQSEPPPVWTERDASICMNQPQEGFRALIRKATVGSVCGPFITDQAAAPDSVLSGDLMNGDLIRRSLHRPDSGQWALSGRHRLLKMLLSVKSSVEVGTLSRRVQPSNGVRWN